MPTWNNRNMGFVFQLLTKLMTLDVKYHEDIGMFETKYFLWVNSSGANKDNFFFDNQSNLFFLVFFMAMTVM